MNMFVTSIYFALSFLLLFAVGEFLYHIAKLKSEYTRKFTHIFGAFITLLFPLYLDSHWAVLILTILFAAVLFATDKFDLLKSVHSVKRKTFGGFLFPVAIYGSFLSYVKTGNYSYYYLPVLILALCDPAAALIGQAFPWKPIKIGSETKTLAGFLSFFFLALAICAAWFFSIGYANSDKYLLIITISVLSAAMEFVSKKGLDNISIPAVVLFVLTLFDIYYERY